MQLPETQIISNPETSAKAVLGRIAQADKNAVTDCIDIYGNLIWAMARKYTDSPEAAENITLEIFQDIWKYAGRCNTAKFDEIIFIILIAQRRLFKEL